MTRIARTLAPLASLAVLATIGLAASILCVPAAAAPPTGAKLQRALLSSRELWATIDICNPTDQPFTVGIRGSMPGDGQAHDRMYMSFRLQYLNPSSKAWVDLGGATSTFVPVGGGTTPRQGGRSFELVPGTSMYDLRGVVEFQWRRGGSIIASSSRPTSAARRTVAGSDPKGYSSATCSI